MSTIASTRHQTLVSGEAWKSGVSSDSAGIRTRLIDAHRHLATPVSRQTVEELFEELAATWKDDTLFESSATALTAHPAYLRIVGLGHHVIPILLRSLATKPDHWFAALTALTGANPVSESDRGDVARMAEAWVRWGKERRLLP